MKTTSFARMGLFACGLATLAAPLFAGPWEPLFNGKDLSGWKVLNGTAPYTAVDGAIVGSTVAGSPNSFLATERTFGDFIFECEVMQEGESNSGIQFRGLSKPDHMNGRVHGYQMEIDASARAWTGGIYDEARRGWLYPVSLNPRARSSYQLGRWNHVRIEAIGSSIRTWINGIPVSHVVDDMTPSGFIALQIHSIGRNEMAGRKVHWRNLRIQTTDLAPSPTEGIFVRNVIANHVSGVEKAQGWRLLWDGKTSTGWRSARGDAFPSKGWSMEDGVLSVLAGVKGGSIISTEEFSAFELQLEFMLSEGANSGVKYLVLPGGEVGFEYQVLDDAKHPDAKQGAAGNRTLASLYDLIPRDGVLRGANIVPRVDQWQHARIVVRPSGDVEHWLNGIKVVEFNRNSALLASLVARSKFAENERFGKAEKSGILLQDHNDAVKFRSIKIRTLSE
jgi:hypothetical protein